MSRDKTILIVDDHPVFREGLKAILSRASGYRVAGEAENGRQALELGQGLKPDVVLLDLSLPDLEGGEVLRRIRAHPRLGRLPVIAVTAQAMAGDRERFLRLGFTDYVTKPIMDFDLFLRSIEQALAGPA